MKFFLTVAGTQHKELRRMGEEVIDKAKTAATTMEVAQIRSAFATEVVETDPEEIRKDFSKFIRDNMVSTGRDAAIDFWGNPYVLTRDRKDYWITSYGPDGTESDDDIDLLAEM